MALIERLTRDPSESVARWIPVHDFFAAAHEIVSGRLTSAQVKTALAMTAPDLVDWNALVALMPPANQAANRAIWVNGLHSCLMLAERRYPGYDTPAAVRAKLGI